MRKMVICYSAADRDLFERLKTHLEPLRIRKLVEPWYDREMTGGQPWEALLQEQLDAAEIILLLISADFFASKECWAEMSHALRLRKERGTCVIPVLLRPCVWGGLPVAELNALPNNPRSPVTLWQNEDAAFENVVQGVEHAALELDQAPLIRELQARSDQRALWDLPQRVPALSVLRDDQQQVQFSMVLLRRPGHDRTMLAWWSEHLDLLRERRKIASWDRDQKTGALILEFADSRGSPTLSVPESLVLDMKAVRIETCCPMEQDPMPGSSRVEGQLLYPDLPLRSEYIDLVELPEGEPLLDALIRGDRIDFGQWQPVVREADDGESVVRWHLRLRGRADPLSMELRLPSYLRPHRAHWMVWPRFRTRRGGEWRTYYVSDYCSHPRLSLDTIWLAGGEGGQVYRRRSNDEAPGYPVAYDGQSEPPHHVGGPPLALSARHQHQDQELGLYLVPLDLVQEADTRVEIGLDVREDHAAVAVSLDGEPPFPLDFPAELGPEYAAQGLTRHVSEDRSRVAASDRSLGILATAMWLATYTRENQSLLAAELVFSTLVHQLSTKLLRSLEPVSECFIAGPDVERSNLSQYIETGFTWGTSSILHGFEGDLQENYLSLLLELVTAELVSRHCGGLPSQPMTVMATYPPGCSEERVEVFGRSLENALRRCSLGSGVPMKLRDGGGLSYRPRPVRAAKSRRGTVYVVADLGGTWLEVTISAEEDSGPLRPAVAERVRLGGDLLLRGIADCPEGLLPSDGSWYTEGDPRDTERKLQAWIRTLGASRLYGVGVGDAPVLPALNIRGFNTAAEAVEGRKLLDRYFRLIAEYLARNLAAYLVSIWFPNTDRKQWERLKISVQLRGEGWRLRYQDESHDQTTETVQSLVRERVSALWQEVDDDSYPCPDEGDFWEPTARYSVDDPERIDAVEVVRGRGTAHEDLVRHLHSFALVNVDFTESDDTSEQIPWWGEDPSKAGDVKALAIRTLKPPVPLSSPLHDDEWTISELSPWVENYINSALADWRIDEPAGRSKAPFGSLIWEALFHEIFPS